MCLVVVVATSLLVGLTSFGQVAFACSCALVSLDRELERVDAVFTGEVTRIGEGGDDPEFGMPLLAIRVEVDEVWDGDVAEAAIVHTAESGAACGYEFAEAERYLVFAREGEEEQLRVSLCSRTAPLAEATDDLDALGTGDAPREPPADVSTIDASPARDEAGMAPGAVAGVAAFLVVLAAAGVLAWRRFT